MSERASPFFCPYCGEEDLRPFGDLDDPHGQWRCTSCRRAFRLRMLGLTRTESADTTDTTDTTDTDDTHTAAAREDTR